jgi:hypothetical protein
VLRALRDSAGRAIERLGRSLSALAVCYSHPPPHLDPNRAETRTLRPDDEVRLTRAERRTWRALTRHLTADRSGRALRKEGSMTTITATDPDTYIDLLKRVVANTVYEDPAIPFPAATAPPDAWDNWRIACSNPSFVRPDFDHRTRATGADLPSLAHTMVGVARLDNVHKCLNQVIADGVPGDFIETGVWRGGVCILARGIFKAHGITDRAVWVADSFEGIPEVGDDGHPLDQVLQLHRANDTLGVSEQTVRENFARYGLLDDQVHFLHGWFCDTLPTAPIEKLAVLRLDGDLHVSTMDALNSLYSKLSVGGYVIIDDYIMPGCQQAVDEFRKTHGLEDDPIEAIDEWSVYWRRSK